MLAKVFKYEMKASSRYLVPVLGGSLAAILLLFFAQLIAMRLGQNPNGTFFHTVGLIGEMLSNTVGTILMSLILFATLGALAVRFYQSFNGHEAYTTFTLPVKVSTHLWGRMLIAAISGAACTLLTVLCFFLFLPSAVRTELFDPGTVIFESAFGAQTSAITVGSMPAGFAAGFAILMVLSIFLGFLCSLLQFYLSIAFGGQFSSGRILISVAAYFVISTIEGILSLVLMALPVGIYIAAKGGPSSIIQNLENSPVQAQFAQVYQWVMAFIVLSLVVTLVFAIVHFLLCKWFYTKRLNVA